MSSVATSQEQGRAIGQPLDPPPPEDGAMDSLDDKAQGTPDQAAASSEASSEASSRASEPVAGRRSVFLVASTDHDRLHLLGMWVLSAASVGEQVDVLLTADPLGAWISHRFGESQGDDSPAVPNPAGSRRTRAAALGLPSPRQLIEEARAFGGVRVLTCDTEARLAGLTPADVAGQVDEVVSLPTFWRETAGCRTVCV